VAGPRISVPDTNSGCYDARDDIPSIARAGTGVYDQAVRFAARADPESIPQRLARGRGVNWRFREWFDTRTVPLPGGPDRAADLVAALDDSLRPEKPWLAVLEFQTEPVEDKLDGTLEEVAILRHRVRHGDERKGKYRVVVGLIHLRGRSPVEMLDMTLPDGSGTRYAPLIWNVAEDDAAATLDRVANGERAWGMLFWIPLMSGGGSEEVIERWKEVVPTRVEEQTMRANVASIALIFAELVGRRIQWQRGLEGSEMTESQVVNEWISQGETRGQLSMARKHIIQAAQRKFGGTVPNEIIRLINQQDSLLMLDEWFNAAIDSRTVDEFIAVLKR
jgi:hypothetical protein